MYRPHVKRARISDPTINMLQYGVPKSAKPNKAANFSSLYCHGSSHSRLRIFSFYTPTSYTSQIAPTHLPYSAPFQPRIMLPAQRHHQPLPRRPTLLLRPPQPAQLYLLQHSLDQPARFGCKIRLHERYMPAQRAMSEHGVQHDRRQRTASLDTLLQKLLRA